MKRLLVTLLMLSGVAFGTTAVTGHISTLGGTVDHGNFVRFWLRGCGGNQPRVGSVAIISPSQGGVYFFDLVANGTGDISGTIYSNRDLTGTGDGELECGGSHTATWYGMQIFHAGKGGPETPILAKNTDSFDISNITPITTNPVVTAPNGDSTYARLNGGNQPFTGSVTPSGSGSLNLGSATNRWNAFLATLNANNGGTLAGTFTGGTFASTTLTAPMLTGTTIFSRLRPSSGTALANTDGALGGNWGTSPSLGISGYDSAFRVVATSGSGSPGANPSMTLTFKDGIWQPTAPVCVASRVDVQSPSTAYWAVEVTSQTTVKLTFVGTPGTSTSYIANVICLGQ